LAKPIKFFDADDHSSGTLTALVANDPTQLQELLGLNMSLVLSAVLSLTGCVIIAFVFGWKVSKVLKSSPGSLLGLCLENRLTCLVNLGRFLCRHPYYNGYVLNSNL
jgi:ABC-type multidrug transport system fused ATPase/permease subunit